MSVDVECVKMEKDPKEKCNFRTLNRRSCLTCKNKSIFLDKNGFECTKIPGLNLNTFDAVQSICDLYERNEDD